MKANNSQINLLWKSFGGNQRQTLLPADSEKFPILKNCKGWCEKNPNSKVVFWFDSRDLNLEHSKIVDLQQALSQVHDNLEARDIRSCPEFHRYSLGVDEQGVTLLDTKNNGNPLEAEEDLLFESLFDDDNYVVVDLFKIVVLLDTLEKPSARHAIFTDADIEPFAIPDRVLNHKGYKKQGYLCDHRLPEHRQSDLRDAPNSSLQDKQETLPNNAFLAFNKKGLKALDTWYQASAHKAYFEGDNAYRAMHESLGKDIPTLDLGISAPRQKE